MERLLQKNVKFILKDIEDGWNTHLDDSDWEDVILPHDWAVERPFSKECSSGTGYLPGGTGWYRIHFDMPKDAGDAEYINMPRFGAISIILANGQMDIHLLNLISHMQSGLEKRIL